MEWGQTRWPMAEKSTGNRKQPQKILVYIVWVDVAMSERHNRTGRIYSPSEWCETRKSAT